MKMETYISDLLYRHNCVIIPGLGGIITNYRSAQIHPVSHILRPPSKSIRFNVNLQEDDGLLANYVSSCESISFASAQNRIKRFVFSRITMFDVFFDGVNTNCSNVRRFGI